MYENEYFAPYFSNLVLTFLRITLYLAWWVGGWVSPKSLVLEPQGILLENFPLPLQYGRVNFEPTLKKS